MREIALDTETTGLSYRNGDRVIEIGCVEIVDHVVTGREFHAYVNPKIQVHPEAVKVHGLTNTFLADKPSFKEVYKGLLDFIGDDTLVIHNAPFDIGFLNAELERLGEPGIQMGRVVDTLALTKRKHPGSPATLDALCKRYKVDNSERTKHGALMDALLLAQIYIRMVAVDQAELDLTQKSAEIIHLRPPAKKRPAPLPSLITAEVIAAHQAFIEGELGDKAIWLRHHQEARKTA